MHECRRCEAFGLRFLRAYAPVESIEGHTNSRVLIVGLNPAVEADWIDGRTREDLTHYFDDSRDIHAYFRDFAIVSRRLFDSLGRPEGAAHADLVKCSSKGWPPPGTKPSARNAIIANCEPYLIEQIRLSRPSLLVCNGAEVSAAMKRLVPPPPDSQEATSYFATFDGQRMCVVLSGFIGRIDHYAKRRLGREIEDRLAELGVVTPNSA
jgi:hypothetical protein